MSKLDKPGVIHIPYKFKTTATYINSEMVWHNNWFINLWLKTKRMFYKSKNLQMHEKYINKTVNSKYYQSVKITKDE